MDTGSLTDPQWHVRQLLMRQGCSDGGRWDVGDVYGSHGRRGSYVLDIFLSTRYQDSIVPYVGK